MEASPGSRRRTRCRLAAVVLLCLGAGCSEPGPPDLLLLTCDTLRADHLGIYGYPRPTSPRLDRFFAKGAIFERAYSTEASTPPAVVSLLSGLHPREHGVRVFYQTVGANLPLLPDLLPEHYQTAAFVSNAVLTDDALAIGTRFDHYDDFVDEKEPHRLIFERSAARTTEAVLRWLDESADPTRPLLLWVHFIDPHGPYRPPADAPVRFTNEQSAPVEAGRIMSYMTDRGVRNALEYVDRYDEEIAYMDASLGALLDGYAARRNLDEAFVLFTADHGETMNDRPQWFRHGHHVWEDLIRVPLLVRGPGMPNGRRSQPISGIDVLPTLLRAAGAATPALLPGIALQEEVQAGRIIEAESFHPDHTRRAIIRDHEKWILRITTDGVDERRYYDLQLDPGERDSVAAAPPPPAGQEARALADPDLGHEWLRTPRGERVANPRVAPRADERQLDALRALGYVE